MSAEGTVICAEHTASCVCFEEPGHDGPHVCLCGGKWEIDADGRFRIAALPGTAPGWMAPS